MTERFTLLTELGRGGMGVVWKARDEETGQIVALKLLRETYAEDPDYVSRFERELELAKRIDSRNVVQVLGYGVRDKTPYLALEFVDGPSLRERLASHGAFSWPEAKALLAQIAQGLADAHAAGVVHRDLKPSNVLIGTDGVAKLADFGIAKGLDLTRMTGTSTLLGTPAYLPPEGPADERSDLYSLGVIAYEILTGVVPFEGRTYQEVILRHVREAPNLEKLPKEARKTVGWLLAKSPAKRPQSASELLKALGGGTSVPEGQAISAGPAAVQPVPVGSAPQRSTAAAQHPAALPPPDRSRVAPRRSPTPLVFSLVVTGLVVCLVAAAIAGGFLSGPSSPTASSLFAAYGDSGGPSGSAGPVDTPSPSPTASDSASMAPNEDATPTATDRAATKPTSTPTPTVTPKHTPTPVPTATPTPTPTPTPKAAVRYKSVSAGDVNTCAIRFDGTLACWGYNSDGRATPPSGTYTAVSASSHACAIRTDGALACWGSGEAATPPSGTYTAVSAGDVNTCAIRIDGTLACWGDNKYGAATPPSGTYTAVSAGEYATCAIRTDGTLACWGSGEAATPPLGTYTAVSAGEEHACAIGTDGTLACWGYNSDGRATPPSGTYDAVGAGQYHTCAIRSDGTLACWGDNEYDDATPPSGTYAAVSGGLAHTCAIRTDGTLACWGANYYGQASPP